MTAGLSWFYSICETKSRILPSLQIDMKWLLDRGAAHQTFFIDLHSHFDLKSSVNTGGTEI